MDKSQAAAALGGAIAGAGLATAAAWAYSSWSRPPLDPDAPVPLASTSRTKPRRAPAHASVQRFQEDDILAEQLTRNVQFFGSEGQQRIADAFVIVVGLGVRAAIAVMAACVVVRSPAAAWDSIRCISPRHPLRILCCWPCSPPPGPAASSHDRLCPSFVPSRLRSRLRRSSARPRLRRAPAAPTRCPAVQASRRAWAATPPTCCYGPGWGACGSSTLTRSR